MLLCKAPLAPDSRHHLLPWLPQACRPSSWVPDGCLGSCWPAPDAARLLQACTLQLPLLLQGLPHSAGLAPPGRCSLALSRLCYLGSGSSSLQAWSYLLPCLLQVKKEFAAVDKAKPGDPSTPFAATKSTSTKVNCELNKGLSLPANAASIFQVQPCFQAEAVPTQRA